MIDKKQLTGKDRYIPGIVFLGLAVLFWTASIVVFFKEEPQFDRAGFVNKQLTKCKAFGDANGYESTIRPGDVVEFVTTDFSNYQLTFIKTRELALACNYIVPVSFCLGEGEVCALPEGTPFGTRFVLRYPKG